VILLRRGGVDFSMGAVCREVGLQCSHKEYCIFLEDCLMFIVMNNTVMRDY